MSELLALSAALCIALSSMLISELRERVSVMVLARWQMLATFAMTGTASLVLGGWRSVGAWQLGLLTLSGLVGIAIASTTYFATIYAAGPRLTALLFALSAPFALALGYLFLGEVITPLQGCGVALVLGGVLLAVGEPEAVSARQATTAARAVAIPPASGKAPARGALSFRAGLAFGVLTAVGQALGSLLARPAMASGVEPFTAMAIRSGVALAVFLGSALVPGVPVGMAIQPRALGLAIASAFLGTTLGMSLLMGALHNGEVGIVTTLSSTTPVLILPMVWLRTGAPPSSRSWFGAAMAIVGIAGIGMR